MMQLAEVNIAALLVPLIHLDVKDFVDGLTPTMPWRRPAPTSSGGFRTRRATPPGLPTTPTPC